MITLLTEQKVLYLKIKKNIKIVYISLIDPKKKGLGKAYIEGFKWAIEKKYKKIIQMDADLSHPPEKLTNIVNELELFFQLVHLGM